MDGRTCESLDSHLYADDTLELARYGDLEQARADWEGGLARISHIGVTFCHFKRTTLPISRPNCNEARRKYLLTRSSNKNLT